MEDKMAAGVFGRALKKSDCILNSHQEEFSISFLSAVAPPIYDLHFFLISLITFLLVFLRFV